MQPLAILSWYSSFGQIKATNVPDPNLPFPFLRPKIPKTTLSVRCGHWLEMGTLMMKPTWQNVVMTQTIVAKLKIIEVIVKTAHASCSVHNDKSSRMKTVENSIFFLAMASVILFITELRTFLMKATVV